MHSHTVLWQKVAEGDLMAVNRMTNLQHTMAAEILSSRPLRTCKRYDYMRLNARPCVAEM